MLCKLKENDTAYEMIAYDYIANINTGSANKMSQKINHVAFMDDANLISNSKENLIALYVPVFLNYVIVKQIRRNMSY